MMYPNKLITQLAFFSFNRFIIAARFPTFPSQESEQRNRPSRLHTEHQEDRLWLKLGETEPDAVPAA